MNGRIYDAKLGRFLQADPMIQAPMNTQSMNRYAYTLNNPLNATDPSGYFFKKLIKIAIAVALTVATHGLASGWLATTASVSIGVGGVGAGVAISASYLTVTSAIIAGAAAGFVGGFAAAALNGASFKDALKAGGFGALQGGVFAGIGVSGLGKIGRVGAHSIAGGALSDLQGGKFGHGFLSAGLTKISSQSWIGRIEGGEFSKVAGRTVVAATVGGTVSKISGGKFANGAETSAFAHFFNQEFTQNFREVEIKIKAKLTRKHKFGVSTVLASTDPTEVGSSSQSKTLSIPGSPITLKESVNLHTGEVTFKTGLKRGPLSLDLTMDDDLGLTGSVTHKNHTVSGGVVAENLIHNVNEATRPQVQSIDTSTGTFRGTNLLFEAIKQATTPY